MTDPADSGSGTAPPETTSNRQPGPATLDAIGDGVYRVDGDGRIVEANGALASLAGVPRERLHGATLSALFGEADRERVAERLERGDGGLVRVGLESDGGEVVPCELRLTPTEDGHVGVVRDVSELDRAGLDADASPPDSIIDVIGEADIGVFVLDEDDRVVWTGPTVERYFGLDREEVIGRDKHEVIEGTMRERVDDGEAFAEKMHSAYEESTHVEEFEWHVTGGEGREERWVEQHSKPIESGRYAGGRLELYYDITDRKRSEGSLRDTEEQFRSLVDAVGEYAIFRLDPDGNVISWNEGAHAIKGYDADEILGEHFSTFYTPEDREAGVPETNLEVATREGSVEDEGWRLRKDGSRFWANVTITAVRDDDGSHRGYLKVTRDMTDRHRRERELESELERMLGRISDAFYAVDEEYRFTHVNERAAELLGYSEEALVDTVMWKVLPDAPELYEEFERALTTQEPVSFERYFEPLDIWAEVNVYPSESGLSVYLLDVTERKEREQALRRTERRFEAIFQDPNILVGLLDPDGTVRNINETAMEYIDADLDDVRGQPFWETPWWGNCDGLRPTVREWVERAAAGEYVDFEADIAGPGDGESTISGFFRPVVDDGEVVSIIVSDRDITERKERERELELFRRLVDHSSDAVFVVDPDTAEILDVNATAGERLGYDHDELVRMSVPEIQTEFENREAWTAFIDEFRESGETTLDGEHRRKDGSTFPVEVEISHVDLDREYLLSVARDVTERKERERYLEDVKSRLEAATEAGSVGTWEWRIPEDEMVVGESFAETFGIDPEEASEGVSLDRFIESIHGVDRERVERAIERAIETGEEYEAEYRVRNADGEYRWIVARGHVEYEDGEPARFPGALTDITDRKRAELELQRNNEQLETLFEVLPVGVIVADGEGDIVSANGTAAEILGADVSGTEDIRPEGEYEVYRADTGEEVSPTETTLARVVDGETATEPDVFEIVAADGQRRIVEIEGRPILDADGEVVRGVVTMSDVTEREEYQRRLEESNERLEQFAYSASHDLQEPLRMVSSYLRLIERRYSDALDEEGEEFLEFAVDGANRMKAMIEGLLAYSRVETRGNPFEPTDLETVLSDVRTDLQFRIEASDATIESEALPTVAGDEDQLRQVFQNLIENAIEYSGDDAPEIHIGAEREGDRWRIDVTDDGIGIDPEDQERVFEVFQRLHARSDHEGTGIGLSLVERIVERHGGEIRVDSEPGEGATFSFTLPASENERESA